MPETWLSITQAAAAIGEHRQQLQRMLRTGRIPRRLIGPGKPPKLRLEGLAAAVRGAKRQRIDSRPGPPLPPKPPPDPVMQAQQQLAMVGQQVAAVRDREAAWLEAYATFRRWISEDYVLQLLRDLEDPCPLGDVMVRCRSLLLTQLAALDQCEISSRFPG